MAQVRLTSTYYNTTGPEVEWRIDICDTEVVLQTVNFQMAGSPTFSFEGLTQDLKPGIYVSRLKFGMYIRDTFAQVAGVNYLPCDFFVNQVFSSNEGRFIVKLYKDDALYFMGVVMPDQCQYEDLFEPYLFQVSAVDGLYRLGSEDYVSEVGQIEYVTLKTNKADWTEFSGVPLSAGLVGTEWVLIEHLSRKKTFIAPFGNESYRVTTYARRELYSIESPGDGWVDQGGNLWAKEVDYFNEIVVNESDYYHLTRDIDNTPMRALSEYIRRAMAIIPTATEYGTDVMYDVVNNWYETGMWDLTADPFTMVRWSEKKFAIGKKWRAVIEDILKHFYCRLYYSNGRYHIEQISERGNSAFTRFCYDHEGTATATESVNLDLNYQTLGLRATGIYKALAPVRSVKVTMSIDSNNLLNDIEWTYAKQGSRNLGRLKMSEDPTRLLISVNFTVGIRVNGITLLPGALIQAISATRFILTIRVRATNIESGTTYHLKPGDDFETSTWETDETESFFEKDIGLPTLLGVFDTVTTRTFSFETFSAELPGNLNDSFDIYMSVNYVPLFTEYGQNYWDEYPDRIEILAGSDDESMKTVDDEKEHISASLERAYEDVNSLDNTLVVEMDAKFCDEGKGDDSIEILSSASPISWRKSKLWNRAGTVTGSVELLLLLAQEICSLRTVPLRLYSGTFYTTIIGTHNRVLRDGQYYLPLNININTDVDGVSGEFVDLQRVTPPDGTITAIPDTGAGIIPIIPNNSTGNPGLFFLLETNEVLTSGITYTESDIVNTLGVHIESGNSVMITDTATGDTQIVVLTQDIEPSDTVMYFTSQLFSHTFPDASIITIVEPDTTPRPPYRFSSSNYTSSFHSVATYYDLEAVASGSKTLIDEVIKIWRNGVLMRYVASGTQPDEYYFDYAGPLNKIIFAVPFVGERLRIEAI